MKPFHVLFCHACFEHLGIEYLSARLGQCGFETSLLFDPRLFQDPFVHIGPMARLFDLGDRMVRDAARRKPDLVAFSVLASDYLWALDLAAKIKKCADVPVVFGGIHATAAPDAVMENPQVDYCIVGEGEQALCDLAHALQHGEPVDAIANLSYRKNGAIIKNPPRPLIADLDDLPFPDKELFYRQIPGFSRFYTLLTRRGCAFQCSYCHNTLWRKVHPEQNPAVRLRSVDNVMDELTKALATYQFKRLRINDDLFSSDVQWLAAFCDRYQREIARPFKCYCSPNHLDDSVVKLLKDAGCFHVAVGVQDVHESVRREIYHRHTPQRRITEAIAALRNRRLRATVDNILGYPGQNEQDWKDIASFYLDNPVYGRITFFWLIYFAGTLITREAYDRGMFSETDLRNLERDPPTRANTRAPSGKVGRRLRRLSLFLLLIQWLPVRVSRWMLEREAYRFLPAVNPSVVEGVWTLFTRDRLDPVRSRYAIKYRHFMVKRLRDVLGI